ncbi:MAG: hypothetical protein ACI8Q1_000706 [Parvicella sp.]
MYNFCRITNHIVLEQQSNYFDEDRISLGLLIVNLKSWFLYLLSKWFNVGLGILIALLLTITYNYVKSPVHYARTSFVLENEGGSEMGNISSLASVVGVSLGGLGSDGSPLFQLENIQSLYGSHLMLEKTLLTEVEFPDQRMKLVQRIASSQKLTEQWSKKGVYLDQFDLPREQFSRAQDSVLIQLVKTIQENHLQVDKQSRKTTILEVGFHHKDELLAKAFNETHVLHVNDFYVETKTMRSAKNLNVLQNQADSIRGVLNYSIQLLAEVTESTPNPNPIYKTTRVPYQKAMIQVQANSAIYQELVKQLEVAKVSLRNTQPLIQVIDRPILPLANTKWSFLKTAVIGGVFGFLVMLLFFTIKRIVTFSIQSENETRNRDITGS